MTVFLDSHQFHIGNDPKYASNYIKAYVVGSMGSFNISYIISQK